MRVASRAVVGGTLVATWLAHARRAGATVPMNPEFLPEAGLLLAAVFTGAIALYLLFARKISRAMRAGAVSLACIALAFVMVGNCHKPPGPPALLPAAENSMMLLLGDTALCVVPSDRYVLSINDKQFLELELRRSGLTVSCVVGSRDKGATGIDQNRISFSHVGIRSSKPDAHTFLLQEEGEDIFSVRYPEPRRIEVRGQFFEGRSAESALISFQDGISWSGNRVPPRTIIDLRDQGTGRIDFGPSGLIRIHRHG